MNRGTARFILTPGGAGSKGCAPACPDVSLTDGSPLLLRATIDQRMQHSAQTKSPPSCPRKAGPCFYFYSCYVEQRRKLYGVVIVTLIAPVAPS